MSSRHPAADTRPGGWGAPALRRATLTLAITQLVSWGVLFYGYAVVASDITADTGWSEATVSGAFALGLLIAGFAAPPVARALAAHDPRWVLTAGSLVGMAGMVGFATAPSPAALYAAWIVIGLAMAVTLYEPAMAVLVAIDPSRRHRTLAVVTVAGGLASTVFAPLCGWLVELFDWRRALVVLGVGGGLLTAVLHAAVLPPAHAHDATARVVHEPAPPVDRPMRRLRAALLYETAAILATTTYLIALLVDRGVELTAAALALGVMGLGKVGGRLLLLGPIGRRSLPNLAATASVVQLAGLTLPLATTATVVLFPAMALVGAASGATTVLRPLIVVDLVGPQPFAATNARLQRATTVARAGAPLLVGVAVSLAGWVTAWVACLIAFAVAAERYHALGRGRRDGPTRAAVTVASPPATPAP